MKKALVITYYWPPAGGSAVQRWLKFSKYLPEKGWEAIVYTPKNAQYTEKDPGLAGDVTPSNTVIKYPIREPYNLYRQFIGMKKKEDLGAYMTLRQELKGFARLKNRISIWVRSNLFIPDARCLWIRPSVKFLSKYLKDNKVDIVITTGPPHSMHLIGLQLKRKLSVPWVADFRDPWTSTDLYASLRLTAWADRKHRRLESNILKSADHIIAIGNNMKEEFMKAGARSVSVITNGYDEDDLVQEEIPLDSKFTILHLGNLPLTRNSTALWKVLSKKSGNDVTFADNLRILLIGSVDYKVVKEIESYGLISNLERKEFVEHEESMRLIKQSQLLLLLINKSPNARGVITGKIFEYLASHRPVLLIGPTDGDACAILKDTEGGLGADFDDEKAIRDHIDHFYDLYRQRQLKVQSSSVEKYSRRNLTGLLAETLDKVIHRHE